MEKSYNQNNNTITSFSKYSEGIIRRSRSNNIIKSKGISCYEDLSILTTA